MEQKIREIPGVNNILNFSGNVMGPLFAMWEPVAKINDALLDGMEKVTRYNYAFAGRCMDIGLSQARAFSSPRDLVSAVQVHSDNVREFSELLNEYGQGLTELAMEMRADFSLLPEEMFNRAVAQNDEGGPAKAPTKAEKSAAS